MVLERIPASDYADRISEAINERDPSLDTRIGPISDLYVTPVARVLERQNNRVVYISNLTSLRFVNRVRELDLNDFVFNEAIIRWEGARSITTITFSRAQPPTSDITVPVNFPVSTETDASTGTSIVFTTIESKTMFSASPSAYYNATTEKYELQVSAASTVVGEETQVGAYSVNVFRRNIAGFDEVTNKTSTTSGRGQETNLELADRYLLHVKGSQLATPAGTDRHIVDNFSSITDVYTVYGNDPYLTRERDDAGAVDIWVRGSSPVEVVYQPAYPGIDTLIPMNFQPVSEIISVSDGGTTYVEGTDYEVVTGVGEYAYSVSARDGIRFIVGGSSPVVGVTLTITYQYNSLMKILTTYYTQPDFYVMGQDRLFRWPQALDLEMDGTLKVSAGNPETILRTVVDTILDFVNELSLGGDVEEFDIDREIGKLYGVDNFTWNTLALKDSTGVSDITVPPTQYAFLAASDLVVSLA